MTKPTPPTRFNAWTGCWLPLVQPGGQTVWASPVEVLTGEHDGVDLDYPRDDFRVFARLLLSAMVQAVFPARDKEELDRRLEKPMKRAEVEEELKPVLADFELFGPKPFLQVAPPAKPPHSGAAPFVFPTEDLFRAPTKIEELSLPIALVALFIEQTYAGGAGRGYFAGPGGQPGALTLVTPPSIRQGAWANTLTSDFAKTLYAKDGARPWSSAPHTVRPRASVGLVGGLFFQPRTAWLIPVTDGVCSFTGVSGQRVRISPLCSGASPLAKKSAKKEDLWQHPCAPLAVNSVGIAPIRLKADRPMWTGLAQLLQPLSRAKKRKNHPREGPAPVLEQWRSLPRRPRRPRLLVLDFNRDKANIKGRFFESYPLSEALINRAETIERLRALVDDAERVANLLGRALDAAHDDRKHGGYARADAQAALWASTEDPFFDWLGAMVRQEGSDEAVEAEVEATETRMRDTLRNSAMRLFDAHTELSEFDPRKQKRIARSRRRLRQQLWPTSTRPQASQPAEATETP